MGVKDNALKTILKRKVLAEREADENINRVLKDEDIRVLFSASKKLIIDIAKLEVDGKDATKLRDEYNQNRDIIAKLLKKKGYKKQDLKPKYTCNKCKDTGYVAGKECSCLKSEISKELIKLSGVDISNFAKFGDDYSMFENPEEIKCIYDKMKKFVSDINKTNIDVVLLMGNTGVGKTHLMECMTTYAIKNGLMIKYTTAFNFNHDMLRYHCSKLEEKEEIMEPYLSSDILFIDDLGSENKIKNVTDEYLYLVINERMLNHKKIAISTNLDFGQIQDAYGERIFSRLMHKKQSLKIAINGWDLRTKK